MIKVKDMPFVGWRPVGSYDVRAENSRAELASCGICGTRIRFVHVYEHRDWLPGRIEIGCECAADIDSRPLLAQIDDDMRSRLARR